jgi:hypothetical protein
MKPQQIASVVTPAAPLRVCHHKQSLRKALGITSNLSGQRHLSGAYLRLLRRSREHAVAPRSRTAASTCPLRTLSLRSAARSLSALSSAQHSLVAVLLRRASLSLSLSLSLLASGSHWHRRLQDSQPASACLPCERERESGREREREGEGERERVAAAQLAPRRRDRDQRQRPQRQPADLRVLRSVSRSQIDPWINRSGGGGGPKRLKRGLT